MNRSSDIHGKTSEDSKMGQGVEGKGPTGEGSPLQSMDILDHRGAHLWQGGPSLRGLNALLLVLLLLKLLG